MSQDLEGTDGIDGPNAYKYALNNPTKYVDPDGRFANVLIGAGIGAVFGAVSAGEGNRLKGALIGAGAGALASTGIGGILGGGILGGLSDAAIQISKGTRLSELDKESIAISTAAGLVGTGAGVAAARVLQVPSKVIGNTLRNIGKAAERSNKFISSAVGGSVSGIISALGGNVANACSQKESTVLP